VLQTQVHVPGVTEGGREFRFRVQGLRDRGSGQRGGVREVAGVFSFQEGLGMREEEARRLG
jgi:hypothetical protein